MFFTRNTDMTLTYRNKYVEKEDVIFASLFPENNPTLRLLHVNSKSFCMLDIPTIFFHLY